LDAGVNPHRDYLPNELLDDLKLGLGSKLVTFYPEVPFLSIPEVAKNQGLI